MLHGFALSGVRGRVRRVGLVALACTALWSVLAQPASAAPPIKHVWVIVLENKGYATTFGPQTAAPYLARELPAQGALLTQYYGIGHVSNDNYIAMVSGQAPNPQSQSDCQQYTDFLPGTIGPSGQAIGQGCVFPNSVKTVADQLSAKGLSWRGYMGDMGNDPSRESATCGHPAVGGTDKTQTATAQDGYATRHDPFVYFHSIIDSPICTTNVVSLTPLASDLATEQTTPNFSFISPSLCDDGHDAPCADGRPGGLTSADAFLRTWVPRITSSAAYKDGGLLMITFDESDTSDTSSCCGELPGPNSPMPGITGPGGGRVGAVLLSPYIRPGTVDATPYNHYSLLRSVEDLFGLDHLGYAGAAGLAPFGGDVYTQPTGTQGGTSSGVGGQGPAGQGPASGQGSSGGQGPAGQGSGQRVTGHGCMALRRLPRARHGRFSRGVLIQFAHLQILRTGARLVVRLRRDARVKLRIRTPYQPHFRFSRRLVACRTYSLRLPRRVQRVSVLAGLRQGREQRTISVKKSRASRR